MGMEADSLEEMNLMYQRSQHLVNTEFIRLIMAQLLGTMR
jgi:hypothetical protein